MLLSLFPNVRWDIPASVCTSLAWHERDGLLIVIFKQEFPKGNNKYTSSA